MTGDLPGTGGLGSSVTLVLDCTVRIFVLSGEGVVLNVVKGSSGETSVASLVEVRDEGGAIDDLLFRKIGESLLVGTEESFEDTGGGESPA